MNETDKAGATEAGAGHSSVLPSDLVRCNDCGRMVSEWFAIFEGECNYCPECY